MERPVDSDAAGTVGRAFAAVIVVVEYAVAISLLLVAAIVLVRTLVTFFDHWSNFSQTVVATIDGILVVVILVDLSQSVYGHLRSAVIPVRPLLVIGILAGVRDILSASARLTLASNLPNFHFNETLISLSVGVGVVITLIGGLFVLARSDVSRGGEDRESS